MCCTLYLREALYKIKCFLVHGMWPDVYICSRAYTLRLPQAFRRRCPFIIGCIYSYIKEYTNVPNICRNPCVYCLYVYWYSIKRQRDTELVTPLGCYNVTYTINVNAIFLHNIPFLQTRFSDHKLYIY